MIDGSRCLVGDIGATYTRFAPATAQGIGRMTVSPTANHKSVQAAIARYMNDTGKKFHMAALAVAGPVSGDAVTLVNANWSFSKKDLQKEFGFGEVLLVNDFEAVAMSIPDILAKFEARGKNDQQQQHRPGEDLWKVGGGTRMPGRPMALVGPGTGLGVGALIPTRNDGWLALPGEGGHATMPAFTREESEILNLLRMRWGHVSAERVLSGAGLVNLYICLCLLHGVNAPQYRRPEDVTKAAFGVSPADPLCVGAFQTFCAMLGTVACNVALTFGATGGLFISGGILPQFFEQFRNSPFRDRFEQKGRLSSYAQAIPTYLVLHPAPALQGLVTLLTRQRNPE
jgi:glucokinase